VGDGGGLGFLAPAVVVVVGEAVVAQPVDREHAGGRLPELGSDLAGDAHPRDLAAGVLAREMPAYPARAAVGGEAERIGGLPDGSRLIVGEVVLGVAAALDDRDLPQVVELLQGREAGMQREP